MQFGLDYSVKDFFFDRHAVRDEIGRVEAQALSKIGAFIRYTAQRKVLLKSKKVSRPGEPPKVHSSDRVANLRNILFAYEPSTHSVIVGPVRLNQVNSQSDGSSVSIPQLLQFGGTILIREEQYKNDKKKRWFRRDLRRSTKQWKRYRTRMATYAPRPYMDVALKMEIQAGTIRNAFKSSIVGGPV